MSISVKVGSTKKEIINSNVKVGGEIKQVIEILTKVNGRWKTAWKGDFFDLNVLMSSTENYRLIEKYYKDLTSSVGLIDLEISVYGANNTLLARVTDGTDGEPVYISSASYNLYNDDESFGEFSILVNDTTECIEYTFSKNSGTSATKIEVKIAKIIKN